MRYRLRKAEQHRGKARCLQLSEIVFAVDSVIKLSEAQEEEQQRAVCREHENIIGYKRERGNRGENAYYLDYKIKNRYYRGNRRQREIGNQAYAVSNEKGGGGKPHKH